MNIKELITSALLSLRANKLRTFLTMLGVIIGVFSVITLIALGRGVQNYITDEFDALGSNLLFVSPGRAGFADDPAKSLTDNKLEEKHLDLILNYAGDSIDKVSPYIISGKTVEYKANNFFAEITGMSSDALTIVNYEVAEGRYFTDTEQKNKERVMFIGPEVAKELFPGNNAVGKSVRLDGTAYEVIGVFKPKSQNYDDQILVPYTTVMEELDISNFASIVAKAKAGSTIDVAVKQLELALLRDLKEEDFTILSQADLLSSINQVLGVLTGGLSAIAGISLLVGGIGIMNIMLVSVTERTREIGLRKALGATPNNIAVQFLSEAVLISFVGGFIGLILGGLATLVAQNFLRAEIPWYAVIVAFGFSAFVGMSFGTYPAVKAGKKDPIVALRYE